MTNKGLKILGGGLKRLVSLQSLSINLSGYLLIKMMVIGLFTKGLSDDRSRAGFFE